MLKAAPASDLHVQITETTYLSATTKGNSSQVTSSSVLGTFCSGNSDVWPVMQNKFHGDQLKEKVKYHTELGFWGNLGITPRSKTVKLEKLPHNNQNLAVLLMLRGHYFSLCKLSHLFFFKTITNI